LNAFKPELSNGAVMDIGIYTIYPMVALFGRPEKIDAQGVLLHTGVDGQGAVNLQYKGMNATILYSKIANSSLPTEIEGEEGNLLLDRIHITRKVDYIPRRVTSQGKEQEDVPTSIGVELENSVYYYEIAEFINLIEQGKRESDVNTLDNSLATIEIIDEIRRQLGVHYPADER
jgi:predicted dehydrogenase